MLFRSDTERADLVELLAGFYTTWNSRYLDTKNKLGPLNLSNSNQRRLDFYESEQKTAVLSILSNLLVAWEAGDYLAIKSHILNLAKEIRPSLAYFERDPSDAFSLTETQLTLLRVYLNYAAADLKSLNNALNTFTNRRISIPEDRRLTPSLAELLLREKLGLSYFDFLEIDSEPEFSTGYYPALLQESVDFGL